MDKFWRWTTTTVAGAAEETATRTLLLEGYIAQESWFEDDVTPKAFKADLDDQGQQDDIIVKIHSPGGDVFAAAQIYNMLKEYKGNVEVHIDGLAASAASVVAMAGDDVWVSPVSVIMVHNPAMFVGGEASDLEVGIQLLSEVKESIINAYERKTGLSRVKIAHMMDAETWMSAHKAVDLGFADSILYDEAPVFEEGERVANGFLFDTLTVTNNLAQKLPSLKAKIGIPEQELLESHTAEEVVDHEVQDTQVEADPGLHEPEPETVKVERQTEPEQLESEGRIPIDQLVTRLRLLKHWR